MGDIADGILEGVFCQQCGDYLGGGEGFPKTCSGCQGHEPIEMQPDERVPEITKKYGLQVKQLNHSTIRITDGKKRLDLFAKKYHKIDIGERGRLSQVNIDEMILEYFNKNQKSITMENEDRIGPENDVLDEFEQSLEKSNGTTEMVVHMPNTESLGTLKDMKTGFKLNYAYKTQEEWLKIQDKPIRCFYMGLKEIPNKDGELVNCATFASESEVFMAGQMVLVDSVKNLKQQTPIEITYRGKKPNKSGGSTNLFDVVILTK